MPPKNDVTSRAWFYVERSIPTIVTSTVKWLSILKSVSKKRISLTQFLWGEQLEASLVHSDL